MNKKIIAKIFTLSSLTLLFSLMFISLVSSQLIIEQYSNGFFSGATNANPELCVCGELVDEIILKNTARFPQVFELNTNLDRAELSFDVITLYSNQEIVIPIVLTASCNEKLSSYDYDVFIRSTTGGEHVISRTLQINKCQTIDAKLFTDKNTSNICEPINYTIVLRNPATYTEDYLIGPLNNVDFYDEIGYSVSLNPNQTSLLNFTFTPSCDVSGEINNKFKIEASSNLQAELNHLLYIEPAYNFSLAGPEQLELCKQEITSREYTITNDGLVANNYTISLNNNPSFITLSDEYLHLNPGESKSFNLIFEPQLKLKDNYNFNLFVEAEIGDFEISKEIALSLLDCFNTRFHIITPPSLEVCQGTQIFHVLLANEGLYNETYNLETNNINAIFSNSSVTIQPGDEVILNLIVNSSEFVDETYFEVYAYSNRDLLTHWEDSISLDVVPISECSAIKFPNTYVTYSRYYEDVVNITVKNIGIKDNTFNIAYIGSDFLNLTEDIVFIESGESYDVVLNKTREHDQDDYYFNLTLTSADGFYYAKEFKLVLTGTPLLEEIKDYALTNPCFLFALIILLVMFFLVMIYLIKGYLFTRAIKTSLISILLIIVIVLVFFNGFPQRINPDLIQPDDPYSFRIYRGDDLVIDLNDFVIDPDEDIIVFEIIDEPSDLDYNLDNNTLTIFSDDFVGSDRFRVLARDSFGDEIVTPRFMVEVVERNYLSAIERYELYCVFINMILLLFLVLFLFLFKDKPEAKDDKQKKKEIKSTSKKTSSKSSSKSSAKVSSKKATPKKSLKKSKKTSTKKPVSKKSSKKSSKKT